MAIRHVGAASTRGLLEHVRRPVGQALRPAPMPSALGTQPDDASPQPDHQPDQSAFDQPASDRPATEQSLPDQFADQSAADTALADVAEGQATAAGVEHAGDSDQPPAASGDMTVDQLVSDMSHVRLGGPPATETPPADYVSIITATIDALPVNSARRRREVYAHAYAIVHERLIRIRPPLASFAIAREELALERAINKIERDYAARFPDTDDEPPPPVEPEQPIVVSPPVIGTDHVVADHAVAHHAVAHHAVMDALGAYAPEVLAADASNESIASAPPVLAPPPRPRPKPPRQVNGLIVRTLGLAAVIVVAIFGVWMAKRSLPGLQKPDETAQAAQAPAISAPQPPQVAPFAPPSAPSAPAAEPVAAPPAHPGRQATIATPVQSALPSAAAPNDILSVCQRAVSPNEFLLCSNAGIVPTGAPSAVDQKMPLWVSSYHTIVDSALQRPSDPATVVVPPPATSVPAARERYESAMLRLRRDDIDRAITDLSEAVRADPQFADGYMQRGQALFRNGDTDKAIADFTQALAIDARHAGAYKARGMALLYKGDEEGAIRDLTSAIQYAELDRSRLPAIEVFYARRSRAMLYDRRQMYDAELADLTALIDGYWRNQILVAALRLTYREQGSVALMGSIYRMRANVHLKRGNIDGAIADLSFAMQLDPQRVLALLLERARVQEGAGRRPQAAADYAKALELAPGNEEAKAGAARLR